MVSTTISMYLKFGDIMKKKISLVNYTVVFNEGELSSFLSSKIVF